MKSIRTSQSGGIEVAIISIVTLIIVGALGYLYWSNFMQQKDGASQQAVVKNEDTSEGDAKDSDKGYLVIKEWGVRAPYTGDDLSYSIKYGLATFTSKKLASKYDGCESYGAGAVRRLSPDDGAYADGTGPKVKDFAKDNPSMYTQVGDYYYQFMHDGAVCNFEEGPVSEVNEANSAVRTLVSKFESASE